MQVLALNGSPRKKKHSATLLQKALEGAEEAGATTQLVHLYEYTFSGCMSCYACKKPQGPSFGKCILHDELTPLLEQCMTADALFFASPIFYGAQSGIFRCFMERLLYPLYPFSKEKSLGTRSIPTVFFYSMIASKDRAETEGYMVGIEKVRLWMEQLLQAPAKVLMCGNAMHQEDYTPFGPVHYDVEGMQKTYLAEFPKQCAQAKDLGAKIVEEIKLHKINKI